ncbi:hypothetical protein C4588_05650 [Candidatus Parcubacteria bacterium]|nr:MAG: hypothetical protein C4588_05650 [Candidatus Parcubacteria bacterium]
MLRPEETVDPFKGKYGDPENSGSTTLTVNGLHCTFNMPKAVERKRDSQGNEVAAGLPPYEPRIGYPVDKFPASPQAWMHGSGKASSYFVPIVPEHGMWLDFNANNGHSHHVAAVISVQGVNPLTGLKADPVRLEQYREKCPKHSVEFQQNRFCPECKFEWHPQNYLSSNSGGPFWVDGFRTEEGIIRQWYFTEEECKGVAAQLIGDERVFAIGIAFYLSKEPKPKPVYNPYAYLCSLGGGGSFEKSVSKRHSFSVTSRCLGASNVTRGFKGFASSSSDAESLAVEQASIESSLKKIEIGAGAKIIQKIGMDPENLDFWQNEPAGMLYINYCDVNTAQRILAAGIRSEQPEGFLGGLNLKS